jgi:hypothetical protein
LTKKVVIVFVRFSCALQRSKLSLHRQAGQRRSLNLDGDGDMDITFTFTVQHLNFIYKSKNMDRGLGKLPLLYGDISSGTETSVQ